jgi:hypothetical protein
VRKPSLVGMGVTVYECPSKLRDAIKLILQPYDINAGQL